MIKLLMQFAGSAWSRWLAVLALGGALFSAGWVYGTVQEGQAHIAYVSAQAARQQVVTRVQSQVIHEMTVQYRDRIKTVYVKGQELEQAIPLFVTPTDTARYGVHAGFVRHYNAAWSGTDPGAPEGADREPAGVSLADIAEVEAHNATACRAWRDKALTVEELYERMRAAGHLASESEQP